MNEARRAWMEFLNPEQVRTKLATCGLFMLGYELLQSSIIDRIFDFFSDGWDQSGPKMSGTYKLKVLSLDPKGKSDKLRSSIQWLINSDVIDSEDATKLKSLTDCRNDFAHEMSKILMEPLSDGFSQRFTDMIYLIQKIEKWWIINFELAIQDDIDIDSADIEQIMTGPMMTMNMIVTAAFGSDKEAWEAYNYFREHWPE